MWNVAGKLNAVIAVIEQLICCTLSMFIDDFIIEVNNLDVLWLVIELFYSGCSLVLASFTVSTTER